MRAHGKNLQASSSSFGSALAGITTAGLLQTIEGLLAQAAVMPPCTLLEQLMEWIGHVPNLKRWHRTKAPAICMLFTMEAIQAAATPVPARLGPGAPRRLNADIAARCRAPAPGSHGRSPRGSARHWLLPAKAPPHATRRSWANRAAGPPPHPTRGRAGSEPAWPRCGVALEGAGRALRPGLGAAEVHLGDAPIAPGLRKGRLLGAEGIEKGAAVITEGLAHQLQHAGAGGGAGGIRWSQMYSDHNGQLGFHGISKQPRHSSWIADVQAEKGGTYELQRVAVALHHQIRDVSEAGVAK